MGYCVKALSLDEGIHSIVYSAMELADRNVDQAAAHHLARYLYRNMETCGGYCAYDEQSQDPCGFVIYVPDELKFLYMAAHPMENEIALSLLEHALHSMKEKSDRIFSTFPRWKETLGSDLLSPHMEALGFNSLTLVNMSCPLSSLAGFASAPHIEKIMEAGYELSGWKKGMDMDESLALLIANPSPLIQNLFPEPGKKGFEWMKSQLLEDERGDERFYPPECSCTVRIGAHLAGVLFCDEYGWINQVAVDAVHRKKGIGKAMIQRAVRALQVLEAPSLSLSVYEENPIARQWYERMGLAAVHSHRVWTWRKSGTPGKSERMIEITTIQESRSGA
jgi:GNAT superfamily N-acetyltransferase